MQSSVIPYVAVAKDQSVAETAVISHASLLHSSSLQCGPALHFLQVKCSGPVIAGRSRLGVAVRGEAKEYCRWRSCAQCMIWCIQGGAVHNRVASGAAPRQNRGSSSDCIPATPCIVLSTTTRREETELEHYSEVSTALQAKSQFLLELGESVRCFCLLTTAAKYVHPQCRKVDQCGARDGALWRRAVQAVKLQE